MADYSLDFQIRYDSERDSCNIFFRCFDTPNSVTVFDLPEPDVVEPLLLRVRNACLGFHRLWSFSSAESDIARINGQVDGIEVDQSTADLLREMIAFNQQEPLFDFTIGPVSLAWKHAQRVPTDEELADALAHVGVSKVTVDGAVVMKADPHLRVDVGGAAKGFVADYLATMLRDAGVESADIDLGGNLFLMGDHPEDVHGVFRSEFPRACLPSASW